MTRGDHALLCRRRYAVLRDVGFRASHAIAPDRFTPSSRWLWLVWKPLLRLIISDKVEFVKQKPFLAQK